MGINRSIGTGRQVFFTWVSRFISAGVLNSWNAYGGETGAGASRARGWRAKGSELPATAALGRARGVRRGRRARRTQTLRLDPAHTRAGSEASAGAPAFIRVGGGMLAAATMRKGSAPGARADGEGDGSPPAIPLLPDAAATPRRAGRSAQDRVGMTWAGASGYEGFPAHVRPNKHPSGSSPSPSAALQFSGRI